MPGFDGTGPMGVGPTTGRGLGPCNNNSNAVTGYARGMRCGRGMGRGRGFGLRARNIAQPRVDVVNIQNKQNQSEISEKVNDKLDS